MLVPDVPGSPIALFWPIELLNILLCVCKRHHIIPVSTVEPDPNSASQHNAPIFLH